MALGPAGLVWLGLNLGGIVCSPTTGEVTFTGNVSTVTVGESGLSPHPLPWLGLNLLRTNQYLYGPNSASVVSFTGNIPTTTASSSGVSPATGVVTLTGNVSSVLSSAAILPNQGLITFTGNQPSVSWELLNRLKDHTLPGAWGADLGHAARWAYYQQGISVASRISIGDFSYTPTTGDVLFEGNVSEVLDGGVLVDDVVTGEVEFTGERTDITLTVDLAPETGLITFTGEVPEINTEQLAQPVSGEITITGNEPYVDAESTIEPETGQVLFFGDDEIIVDAQEQAYEPTTGEILFVGNVVSLDGAIPTAEAVFRHDAPSGGYRRKHAKDWFSRLPTPEEVQAEREAMGILPKKVQKIITATVDKATDTVTAQQAPLLAAAYLEETKQRALADDVIAKAKAAKVKWDQALFDTTLTMILDELRKKSDKEELDRILLLQEHEEMEVNDILELWMNDL